MRHHLVKEGGNPWHCLYCSTELSANDWQSVWESQFHYKVTRCKCGKKQRVKVNFCGSGHDDWDEQFSFIFDKEGKINIENKKKESVEQKILRELALMDRT